MSHQTVFGVYGPSNSGKTKLVEQLVSYFTKQGYVVATVKKTKKAIGLDTPQKDTWRHHAAGARLMVFSSASETDFLLSCPMSLSEIITRMAQGGAYDLILVEGADDATIPKIQVGAARKRKNTVAFYDDNLFEIIDLINQEMHRGKTSRGLVLTVNGKHIPLTEFPTQMMTSTIIGMLQSLKGVGNIKDFSIHFSK